MPHRTLIDLWAAAKVRGLWWKAERAALIELRRLQERAKLRKA